MIAVDTNVLARWLLRDDEEQFAAAERILAGPIWLGWTVILELGWLLSSYAGLDRKQLCAVFETVLALPGVELDRRDRMLWVLERYRNTGDFADLIHIASAGHVAAFVSFERRLARHAGPDSPVPVKLAKS